MKSLGSARSGAVVAAVFTLAACGEGSAVPPGTGGTGGSPSGTAGTGTGGSSAGAGGGGAGTTAGGTGGAGGGTSGMTETLDFETDLEGFAVNYYCTATNTCMQVEAAPAPATDAGADAGNAGPVPISNELVVLSYDSTEGSPDPGSARLEIQFSAAGQQVQLAYNTPNTDEGAINMEGKIVTAQVRTDVAGSSAKMVLKSTGTYIYADGGQVPLVAGAWTPVSYTPGNPMNFMNPGFLITDIREIGLSFETTVMVLTPTVINVDTVQY